MTEPIKASRTKGGKSESDRHYANTLSAKKDLSLAGNPLGPSPTIKRRYKQVAAELGYLEGSYSQIEPHLIAKIKKHYGIEEKTMDGGMTPDVHVGYGCTGVIKDIFRIVNADEYLVVPDATFPVPAQCANYKGMPVYGVSLKRDLTIDIEQIRRTIEKMTDLGHKVGMVFLANPNNPTGCVEPSKEIADLAWDCGPKTLVVVSEANIDYVPESTLNRIGGTLLDPHNFANLPTNLMVLRTFSKIYGLAPERIGCAIGNGDIIKELRGIDAQFNMPAHSIISAYIALDDQKHVARCRDLMEMEIKKIANRLQELGFPDVSKSDSNLLVAKIPLYFSNSDELASLLRKQECAVISCGAEFGEQLGRYIRIAPSLPEKNDAFLEIIANICQTKEKNVLDAKRKRAGATHPRTLSDILRKPTVPSNTKGSNSNKQRPSKASEVSVYNVA